MMNILSSVEGGHILFTSLFYYENFIVEINSSIASIVQRGLKIRSLVVNIIVLIMLRKYGYGHGRGHGCSFVGIKWIC